MLVVDDAVTFRASLERLLGDAGFEVAVAANGPDGLVQARKEAPHLIVADLKMQQEGGLAMIRALRADCGARHVPILVLSTENAEDDFAQAREAGANYFVVKPPEPETFVALVALMSAEAGGD